MDGYLKVSLGEMIKQLGEDRVKSILSSFSCELNIDVEQFLKRTAIPLEKQGVSKTMLVFTQVSGEQALIGYFTLANKFIAIDKAKISESLRKRVNKFCNSFYDPVSNSKIAFISAPLIGQLGKNYTDGLNKQITGDELLKMACEQVARAQECIGGKIVYLECEDKHKLIEFYKRNRFFQFGKRDLDADERDTLSGQHLIQMLRYM